MNKNEIIKKIKQATNGLIIEGIKDLDLFIGGSSALILSNVISRASRDIDLVKSVSHKTRKILKQYQINDDIPNSIEPNLVDDYGSVEKTSIPIYKKDSIRWFFVWPEVVLISKWESKRAKDAFDIEEMQGKLSKTKAKVAMKSIREKQKLKGFDDPNEFLYFKEILRKVKWRK